MCVYKMQATLKKKNPKAGRQREKAGWGGVGVGGAEPRTDETNRKQIAR